MLRSINPSDAAIFTGMTGVVMVLMGREIGGAICLSGSCLTFAFLRWLSNSDEIEQQISSSEDDDQAEDLEDLAIQSDLSYRRMKDEEDRAWRSYNGGNGPE